MTRVLGRAAVLTLAQGIAALGSAVGLILFSTLMTPEAFGRGMLLVSLGMAGSLLATLNLEAVAVRVLPGPAGRAYRRVLARVFAICGTLGAGLAFGWAVLGGWSVAQGAVLAALIPAVALVRVLARAGTSLGAPLRGAVPRLLARPLAFGGGALVLWGAGAQGQDWMLPVLLLGAMLGAGLLQAALLRRRLQTVASGGRAEPRAWLIAGLALAPGLLFLEYHRHLVLIAAAPGLAPDAVGHLSLALSLAALPALPVIAVEMALTAPLARAIRQGDAAALRARLTESAGLRLAGLALGVLALWIGQPWLDLVLPDPGPVMPLTWWLLLPAAARGLLGNPLLVMTLHGRTPGLAPLLGLGLAGNLAAIWAAAAMGGALAASVMAGVGYCVLWAILWRRCCAGCGIDTSLTVLRSLERPRFARPLRKA
ncbi:hypothetical protein [Oceanibium sediminis]|uniref:hypothetical protein n=1 Tax=Oceanibium sediminis TaxID=2026339 RepID=UPI0013007D2D